MNDADLNCPPVRHQRHKNLPIILAAVSGFLLAVILGAAALLFVFLGQSGGTQSSQPGSQPSAPAVSVSEQNGCQDPNAGIADPDSEVRGVYIATVTNINFPSKPGLSADELRAELDDIIKTTLDANLNAIYFQVRPASDALYKSDIFPTSVYLTGEQGKSPDGDFDPLGYLVETAHELGIKVHAWVNPLRVTVGSQSNPKTDTNALAESNPARLHPEYTVAYADGRLYYNAGMPEARALVADGVREIVEKYDVDGIIFDDYFYPYPAAGKAIPDDESYKKFGNGMNRGDWRRQNVDKLIEQLHATIKRTKPWVRFGVSPFGIWRNKRNDPRGSNSSGLQNYDDLYADVILWAKKGWVDYLAPQLYWSLDTQAAPSRSLAQWWNDNANGVDIYIGQDVKRTMDSADPGNHDRNELDTKVKLSRLLPNVKGNIWWHGYWVTGNYKGAADSLSMKYQSTIALPPAYGDQSVAPKAVKELKLVKDSEGEYLEWKAEPQGFRAMDTDPVRFVVYEFFPGEEQVIDDPQTIVALTPYRRVKISDDKGVTYAVTALDRMNRESKPIFLYVK